MIINKQAFGDFLARARVKAGIPQLQLARALGYSSPQYVSNWERGICGPPLDKLRLLATSLGIDPRELMEMILAETEAYLRKELRLDRRPVRRRK